MRLKVLLPMILLLCMSCAHEFKIIDPVPKERVHYYTKANEVESTITFVSDKEPFYHFYRRRIFIIIDNTDVIEFRDKEVYTTKIVPGKHTLAIAECIGNEPIITKYKREIYVQRDTNDTYHIFVDGLGGYKLIWR